MSESFNNEDKEISCDDVPLTRTKGQKITKQIINEESMTKPTKEKKPRSEKQIEQFKQAQQKRKEAIDKRNTEKKIEASKILLANNIPLPAQQKIKQVPTPTHDNDNEEVLTTKTKPKKQPKIVELDNTDSESEDSIIIVKKKSKPKKKKKIIIQQSDSESSGDDEPPVQVAQAKEKQSNRAFVSQQNKKSVIKIHDKPILPSFEHYFV